jgi:hypothetical protein
MWTPCTYIRTIGQSLRLKHPQHFDERISLFVCRKKEDTEPAPVGPWTEKKVILRNVVVLALDHVPCQKSRLCPLEYRIAGII